MQRGHITKHHGSWFLRFYDVVLRDGQAVKKLRAVKLTRISETYPTKRSVERLAEKYLAPVNAAIRSPEAEETLANFIEKKYLPHVRAELRPVTAKSYSDIFENHLKSRTDRIMLRDSRTVHGQRLLKETHQATGIGHTSCSHIKSMLSGVFSFALREGVLDGVNPIRPVQIPGRVERRKQPVYRLEELVTVIFALSQPEFAFSTDAGKSVARFVVIVAAFTGLRVSELRGLRWSDYDGENLYVKRSVWRTTVSPTKTLESENPVPVLRIVRTALEAHRGIVKPEGDEYIFAGSKEKFCLDMENLATRVMKPRLVASGLTWKGWHAFRRGLASNLYAMEASARVVQSILRHSAISSVAIVLLHPDQ